MPNMEAPAITIDNLQSVCRTCMCNCKNEIVSNGRVIFEKVFGDVPCVTSVLVSKILFSSSLLSLMCPETRNVSGFLFDSLSEVAVL